VLWATTADTDSGMRYEAVCALIAARDLEPYNDGFQCRLGIICGQMFSPLTSVRDLALADLHEIFARLAAGQTPQRVGLTLRADTDAEPLVSFMTTFREELPQAEYPVAELTGLTGWDRLFVENLLLRRLSSERRAVRAVARLRVRRAIEPLHELVPADNAATAEIAETLRVLGTDP
jgi:hypothetical protein